MAYFCATPTRRPGIVALQVAEARKEGGKARRDTLALVAELSRDELPPSRTPAFRRAGLRYLDSEIAFVQDKLQAARDAARKLDAWARDRLNDYLTAACKRDGLPPRVKKSGDATILRELPRLLGAPPAMLTRRAGPEQRAHVSPFVESLVALAWRRGLARLYWSLRDEAEKLTKRASKHELRLAKLLAARRKLGAEPEPDTPGGPGVAPPRQASASPVRGQAASGNGRRRRRRALAAN